MAVRSRTRVYTVILILFWTSVFTYVSVALRYRTYSRESDEADVHSDIVGALTGEDDEDHIVTNSSDEILDLHSLHQDDHEGTTRADFEFENDHDKIQNEELHLDGPHGSMEIPSLLNQIPAENSGFQQAVDNPASPAENISTDITQQEVPTNLQSSLQIDPMNMIPNQESQSLENSIPQQDSWPPANAEAQQPDLNAWNNLPKDPLDYTTLASQGLHPDPGHGQPPGGDPGVHFVSNGFGGLPGEQEVNLDPKRFSLHVTNHMIDNFQVKLPPLLDSYKNPCWLEDIDEGFTYEDSYFNTCNVQQTTGQVRWQDKFLRFHHDVIQKRAGWGAHWRIRCFPYFFLLGVGKCGTTDLFTTLKTYSKDVAPTFLKEPHFWEWKRCHYKMHCHGRKRNPQLSEYLDAFDHASERTRQERTFLPNGTEYHPMIIGDFTPSTLTFSPCWSQQSGNEGLDEPRYTTAHYLYSIRPQTKFIAVMRDPVERIFSNYKMKFRLSNRQGNENAKVFHDEMVNATSYMINCMTTRTPRSCAYSFMRFDYMTHVSNSMYEIFINDWLNVFPREQFLFLRMEDYMENRVPHVKSILSFLGLDDLTPEQEADVTSKQVINKAPETEAMFDETRKILQDFFRPFNARLAALLGDDSFTWGY